MNRFEHTPTNPTGLPDEALSSLRNAERRERELTDRLSRTPASDPQRPALIAEINFMRTSTIPYETAKLGEAIEAQRQEREAHAARVRAELDRIGR